MSEPDSVDRDFLAEFQANIRKMESAPIAPVKSERLYDIHKRSLPVGIDKVVVFSVTKKEAERWVETRLKTRCYENAPDDSRTLIYYDVIPVDATPRERAIYFNTSRITV